MMRHILRWFIGFISIAATVYLLMKLGFQIEWKNIWGEIIFVPVLAFANITVKPIVKLISIPINCLTFGLFSLVISAAFFAAAGYLTGAKMGFLAALCGSVIYTLLSGVLSHIFVSEDNENE